MTKEITNKKTYGIYSVEEYPPQPDGKWGGYRCGAVDILGKKQGKLYIKSDGRENYQAAPPKPVPAKKDEELEI